MPGKAVTIEGSSSLPVRNPHQREVRSWSRDPGAKHTPLMAPPALSTRDTRTLQPSIYHLPIQQHSPSLPLIRFSRYYSLAPALPTLDSLILDLPFFLSSFLFPFLFLLFPLLVCFKPYTFSVSRFLFSSLRQRSSRFPSGLLPFHPNPSLFLSLSLQLTVFLIPFPVLRVFYIAPRLEGCCIERTIR